MFVIYKLLINLIIIISPIILLIRILKNKEHKFRFKEKFCYFSKLRGNGKLIWFHGSSVGEILSIIPLVEKLENDKSINKILITSSTLSSSKVLSKFKLKKTIHQFFPIDSDFLTKKFLNYWKPTLAIFIESEIWPNMLLNIKNKHIPLLLLNARITKKSYEKWKKILPFSKIIFSCFNSCYPQNSETQKYLKSLGAKNIKHLGNLKFTESKNQKKENLTKNIKKNFTSRKIWCAASTHNNEERICAIAHMKLKKKYKNLLTIIIPRHIQRTNSLYNEITEMGLNVEIHSSKRKIKKDTDIYIVDTYGETKSFFKICNLVFLGGSVINHGGQNPLEAARLGCKILYGPNVQNFKEIYELLNKDKLCFKFHNINQLITSIEKSFNENMKTEKKINKLKKTGLKILNLSLREINKFI